MEKRNDEKACIEKKEIFAEMEKLEKEVGQCARMVGELIDRLTPFLKDAGGEECPSDEKIKKDSPSTAFGRSIRNSTGVIEEVNEQMREWFS